VPLKLKGSTSGSVELDVPAVVGGDVSLELPGGGTVDRLERAGNILQVVQGTTTTEVTVTTTTWTDTTLSATITPTSATSKVLIIVNQHYYATRSNFGSGVGVRILRGTTVIDTPIDSDGTRPRSVYAAATGATTFQNSGIYNRLILDSPSTTSSVTYKTEGRPFRADNSGLTTFQETSASTQPVSSITLMEIAA